MGQIRITGAEIDRGDAERGEPRDVGPAVLGAESAVRGVDQCGRGGMAQSWKCSRGGVGQFECDHLGVEVFGEDVADVVERVVDAAVGSEAEIDGDPRVVGDDVARNTSPDADGRQPLAVLTAVDVDVAGFVVRERGEHTAELVNRVVAHPGSCGVRTGTRRGEPNTQCPLATRLDLACGRLAENGDVSRKPFGQFTFENSQTVVLGGDLLTVVEDEGQVMGGIVHRGRKVEEHRVARFHVDRAAAVQHITLDVVDGASARQVVGDRDGVEVTGEDDPAGFTPVGAGHHAVAVPEHVEPDRLLAQGLFHGVGDRGLVARLALDVDEGRGQFDGIGTQIEVCDRCSGCTHDHQFIAAPCPRRDGRLEYMYGTVIHAPFDVRFEEVKRPQIDEPTDAIVRLTATCVCGSDLWTYRGINAIDRPVHMGHEYVGIVEEVGSAVRTVAPGQFVIGSFFASDNTCEICLAGYQTGCVHRAPVRGAQAEYLRVPLADGTLVATPEVPDDEVVPDLLAASDVLGTGWFGATAAEVGPGKTVVVVGDGAVGLLAVLASAQLGAERIIVMSRHEQRQTLALEFGATDIVVERGDEGVSVVKDLTHGVGAHSVIEAVGTQQSMTQAIDSTRPGGHVGFVGVAHGVELPGDQLFYKLVHLHGGPAPVRRFLPELITRITNREINPGKVFDLELPLSEVAQGYAAMDERRAIKTLLRP